MTDALLAHESWVRLGFFLGVLVTVALWETVAPLRRATLSRRLRWWPNLTLVAVDTLLVRLLFPVTGVALAARGEAAGWGVLGLVTWPPLWEMAAGLVMLDFIIYVQHVFFHAVPTLWRLHMVHHADLDMDVSTGLRFHPMEIVISMVIKLLAILAIAPSPATVVVFEVVLNAMAMFNHGNIRLPGGVEQVLRWLVVTPAMHTSHHSVVVQESNCNFGFNLSWWDRLFGTHLTAPQAGYSGVMIGLEHLRHPQHCQPLVAMLWMPLAGKIGRYVISQR